MAYVACCQCKPISLVLKLEHSVQMNEPKQNDKETVTPSDGQLRKNIQEIDPLVHEDSSEDLTLNFNKTGEKKKKKVFIRNGIEVHLEPLADAPETNLNSAHIHKNESYFDSYIIGGFLIVLFGVTLLFSELLYAEYQKYSFICFGTLAITIIWVLLCIIPSQVNE